MTRACLLSAAFALSLAAATGADWPRFRGPNGTGVADGPLPPIDPKSPLWKVPVGKGNGSPIVVGDKLLFQAASDDGKKRMLVCLDAATGKGVWAEEVPGRPVVGKKGDKSGGIHTKNSLSSSTPASDGEAVYCVFWDGTALALHAFGLDGKPRWTQSLGAYASEHGAGHSPAVYGGKVFVNFDQDGSAVVMAFDAKTGNKAWQKDRPAHRASYTTPQLLEQPGKPAELIVGSTTGVDSYDPQTGAVNWHYTIGWDTPKKLRMIGCPVFAAGVLAFYCGEGGAERYIVGLKPGGTGDVTKTAKAWDAKKQCPYVPSMLAKGDLMFWVHDTGRAGCLDAKTGAVLWDEVLFGGAVSSSPVLVGDQYLAVSEKGEVAVVKAAKEFEVVKKASLGEVVYATPAVANGRVYVRTTTHLYCFGAK
ncbi:MAG: hypothetical protein C0501_23990 [Isosphaera sp.]|nr:hypothetical protein [Isosphaera sp.]